MRDFDDIKALVGATLRAEELKYVDCYVHKKLGVFIPSMGACKYAAKPRHTHPSFMIAIFFSTDGLEKQPGIIVEKDHYYAVIVSPEVPHDDFAGTDYYCIMIEEEYFLNQYRLYRDDNPHFLWEEFSVSGDVLRLINTFAMEYSRMIAYAEITLDAQVTLLTHWIIRSLTGNSGYAGGLSANCSVARTQHYMELHYHETITVRQLAAMEHMSESGFSRLFKRETGITPIQYLMRIRIERAKILLQQKNLPISEAGEKSGFGSSTHFATEFRRLTGVSPSRYREAYHH